MNVTLTFDLLSTRKWFPDDNWSNFLLRVIKLDTLIAYTKTSAGIVIGLDQSNVKVTGDHFFKVTGSDFQKSAITPAVLHLYSPNLTHM